MVDTIKILSKIEYDGHLSATAYTILVIVLMGIICGLGWCLYRAIVATDKLVESQFPDDIGDDIR